MANKHFFDTVRPLFGGRLTSGQVDGMNRIVEFGLLTGVSREHLSYILATVKHETANWMQPIREGARRYGTDYTDAQSRRAVERIFAKGIIRQNYALPVGPYGHGYYGRGLIQITWYDNYVKMGDEIGVDLEQFPDKALEWPVALKLLFIGMQKGMYTGKSLDDYNLPKEFYYARSIVNGDRSTWGNTIANYARTFYEALNEEYQHAVQHCTKDG